MFILGYNKTAWILIILAWSFTTFTLLRQAMGWVCVSALFLENESRMNLHITELWHLCTSWAFKDQVDDLGSVPAASCVCGWCCYYPVFSNTKEIPKSQCGSPQHNGPGNVSKRFEPCGPGFLRWGLGHPKKGYHTSLSVKRRMKECQRGLDHVFCLQLCLGKSRPTFPLTLR